MSNNKNSGLVFMGLGFELLVMFLVGAYVGKAIDAYMGWPGWGFLGMIAILMFGWVVHFVFLVKRFMKASDESDPKP